MAITGFKRATSAGVSAASPVLDESQQSVVSLPEGVSAAVIGAPGSGKTTAIVELVAERVLRLGWSPDELVVLTPSRASASLLRTSLALRLGVPSNGPLARTVNSLAFEVVGRAAALAGAPAPRLVTGGEQDADIAQLLEGHLEEGTGPDWPESLGPEVRALRGFRSELRELMARATEFGVTSSRLAELGVSTGRPEWVAAAGFIDDYLSTVSAYRESQFDSAELAQFAVQAIASGDPGERVSRLRLVIIDDVQEATESTLAILRALAGRGVPVIAFGDPDVAANAFRGGEQDALGRLSSVLGVSARTIVLSTVHRHGPAIRALTSNITERIGTAAAGPQRAAKAVAADAAAPVTVITAPSPAREWSAVARQLREHHLLHGVPFSDMAVVVRSGQQIAAIRRALALAEVPARTSVGTTALRDDRAARALLTVVDVGVGRSPLTAQVASELLSGPFGALDSIALRRLRLALRAEELAGGNNRTSDELLVEGLAAPGRFATIDHRVARDAEKLALTLAALAEQASLGATIEELLWLAWERSGLAKPWRDQALSAGIAAAEANQNLDGILALFTAAKRFVERQPGRPASDFLVNVLEAEVPEDTLSPQPADDAVLVTTPSAMVGLEFDIVVVAALQEGSWPNLRLRGSLLGPQDLVREVTAIDAANLDERKLVLGDELRMFALAVSRARSHVVLAAVANDDEAPSVFLSLVAPGTPVDDGGTLPPLSLRALTGRLRRQLVRENTQPGERDAAASALALLATHSIPGADPSHWHGLLEPSTTEPLFRDDERVPVSPSRLERFESSPLDWFVESIAGSQPSTAMSIGTIVHWAMETALDPSVDGLMVAIESRWQELLFEAPWMGEYQKRAARVLAGGIAEYLGDFARDGKTLVGAESRFQLAIDQADVNGSIDRVERSADGSVVIVDLKTGAALTRQNDIDAHPQLGAYQLAYAAGVLDPFLDELGEHTSGGAKLLYVKKGVRSKLYREGVQAPLADEQLEQFRERIRQAAAGMAAAHFTGAIEISTWGGGGSSDASIHRVKAVSSD
ncbi:MAG: PD-(D/E)XK nuclease family protein [Microbacteriaceae bacterium]